MQEKLFVTEPVLNSSHDMVDEVVVPQFTEEGVRPKAKTSHDLKTEDFEKEWKYGSTTVYWHQGQYFFVGDIEHCSMENIFFNATKMRDYMHSKGLKCGHMNYNDPPTYKKLFDKNTHDKDMELYEYKTYTWNGSEPLEVKDGAMEI